MEEETEFCLMEKQERKEVVAEPDVVIGRALNIQKIAKDEQKDNIFHNKCTIQAKSAS